MLNKAQISMKGPLVKIRMSKVILVRARKEKVRATEYVNNHINNLTEYINDYKQNISKNMDAKSHSGEVADGNEEKIIGNWRKGDLL